VLDEGAVSGPASAPDTGRGAEAVAIAYTAQAALASGGFDGVHAHVDSHVLTLDARGEAELQRALVRWQQAVERIAHASAKRLAGAGELAAHRCEAVVMCFELPAGLDAD
jgi:hypothetical protein